MGGYFMNISINSEIDHIKSVILHEPNEEQQYVLPEPLYDPISETFVKRMTAETYDVKEGDYIQIIDTSGRQCSDFLAFDKKKTR